MTLMGMSGKSRTIWDKITLATDPLLWCHTWLLSPPMVFHFGCQNAWCMSNLMPTPQLHKRYLTPKMVQARLIMWWHQLDWVNKELCRLIIMEIEPFYILWCVSRSTSWPMQYVVFSIQVHEQTMNNIQVQWRGCISMSWKTECPIQQGKLQNNQEFVLHNALVDLCQWIGGFNYHGVNKCSSKQ